VTGAGSDGTTSSGEGARTLTAADIAAAVGGEVRGDPAVRVRAVAPLDRAGDDDLTFLASPRYAPLLASRSPGVLLVTPALATTPGSPRSVVVVEKPLEALIGILPRLYQPPRGTSGIHPTAVLGRGVSLGRDVAIGPYAVLGDGVSLGDGTVIDAHVVIGAGVSLGTHCRLFPGVTVYSGSEIGNRVIAHAGVRIGGDGYGYVFAKGAHQKIPHVGRCLVGDDVEIGANTTIDRGSIDDTVVGAGTKIDNLVQVGHNCRIGKLCLIMSQVGMAGSTRIGDGVVIAGQAGLGGHLEIGDRAQIAGQAGVFGDVPAGETWSGYPARPHRESLRASAALLKLAGMIKQLERLLADRTNQVERVERE
jgi:UDP-3-O-[3-hydroxymyristoyl] glucosamine N-acyltransferase